MKTFKAKARGAEIDPAEYEQLKSDLEETKSALSKAEKTYKAEIEKLTKNLGEKDGALQKYLIDGGLTDALAKAGVAPQFMDAAKALLRQQAAIKADDSGLQAVLGDKPMMDAIKEWAASDTGKHFVAAPRNSGGGAAGSQNGGTQKPFKDMTSEERTTLYRTNPAQYEALKKQTE
ncbi:MAG TPA: hypothetical protein VFV43_09180 [Limnobacter sp.]|nr:hypothetical protein [Limnobacter sp.]